MSDEMVAGTTVTPVPAQALLFIAALRHSGERVERLAEGLDAQERNDVLHREMLEAAAPPRSP